VVYNTHRRRIVAGFPGIIKLYSADSEDLLTSPLLNKHKRCQFTFVILSFTQLSHTFAAGVFRRVSVCGRDDCWFPTSPPFPQPNYCLTPETLQRTLIIDVVKDMR